MRVKKFVVSIQFITSVLATGNIINAKIIEGLPEGSEIVDIEFFEDRVEIYVKHNSFDIVRLKPRTPTFDIRFEQI